MCSTLLSTLVVLSLPGCANSKFRPLDWLHLRPFSLGKSQLAAESSLPAEGQVISEELISEEVISSKPIPAPEGTTEEVPQTFSPDTVIHDSGADVIPLQSGQLNAPIEIQGESERNPAPINILPEK
jgi:hypothetical protein